jgi:hypothetical protein
MLFEAAKTSRRKAALSGLCAGAKHRIHRFQLAHRFRKGWFDLHFRPANVSIVLKQGCSAARGAEKIPSNPIRIMPAWEAFLAGQRISARLGSLVSV